MRAACKLPGRRGMPGDRRAGRSLRRGGVPYRRVTHHAMPPRDHRGHGLVAEPGRFRGAGDALPEPGAEPEPRGRPAAARAHAARADDAVQVVQAPQPAPAIRSGRGGHGRVDRHQPGGRCRHLMVGPRSTGAKVRLVAVILLLIWLLGVAAPSVIISLLSGNNIGGQLQSGRQVELPRPGRCWWRWPPICRCRRHADLHAWPTETPIPTPTFTPTATPTETPIPTPTFTPTDTPIPPTDTPVRRPRARARPRRRVRAALRRLRPRRPPRPAPRCSTSCIEMRRHDPVREPRQAPHLRQGCGCRRQPGGWRDPGPSARRSDRQRAGQDGLRHQGPGPGRVHHVEGRPVHRLRLQDGVNPASTDIAQPLHPNFTDEANCSDGGGGNTLFHNSFNVVFQKNF